MRLFSILTSSALLLVLQELISAWFLVDFFLARDSSFLNGFKKSGRNDSNTRSQPIEGTRRRIINTISNELKNKHCSSIPEPVFDKIVLVIIDALGSEFISAINRNHPKPTDPSMPFIDTLLRDNRAMGFTAVAATPTVTMPRLKAIVSGSNPGFAEILFNLAKDVSNASRSEDNLLKIAKARGKSIVFYGDDTWLSLFDRSTFLRSRETLSLYANDYTSVDTNVTEMALPETRRDHIDWDYLVLHYLGLDHLGHSFGTNANSLISKKLKELDDVLREIYENLSKKKEHKFLMVVCGDHGMSEEGNHGGDSIPEADTAMLFFPLNINFHAKDRARREDPKILQIDLATTLSYLSGMPTPSISEGIPIESFIKNIYDNSTKSRSSKRLMCIALETLVHLVGLLEDRFVELDPNSKTSEYNLGSQIIELLNEHSISTGSETVNELMSVKYFALSKQIQDNLISTITNKSDLSLIVALLIIAIILTSLNFRRSCIKLLMPLMPYRERILCSFVIAVPIVMQVSTDYIEQEHQYWPIYALLVFIGFIVVSLDTRQGRLRRTMDKLDLERTCEFFVTFLVHYLWNRLEIFRGSGSMSLILALIVLCNFSRKNSDLSSQHPRLSMTVFFSFGLFVYFTKSLEESALVNQSLDNSRTIIPVASAQILCFMLLVSITFINIWSLYSHGTKVQASLLIQKFSIAWIWFALLLSRPRNFIYLVSNMMLEGALNSMANTFHLAPMARCLIYLQFSTSAFYNQGNSNLFTSIDVKPSFFGQNQYNLALAAPLVACATYSSQIYWYLKLFQRVQGDKEQDHMQIGAQPTGASDLRTGVRDFIDMQNYLALAFYMLVCLVLRNHLFVWSVLSPKLVYHWTGTMVTLRLTTLLISTLPSLAMYFMAPKIGRDLIGSKESIKSNV